LKLNQDRRDDAAMQRIGIIPSGRQDCGEKQNSAFGGIEFMEVEQ
jgi:hypothetical protein